MRLVFISVELHQTPAFCPFFRMGYLNGRLLLAWAWRSRLYQRRIVRKNSCRRSARVMCDFILFAPFRLPLCSPPHNGRRPPFIARCSVHAFFHGSLHTMDRMSGLSTCPGQYFRRGLWGCKLQVHGIRQFRCAVVIVSWVALTSRKRLARRLVQFLSITDKFMHSSQ